MDGPQNTHEEFTDAPDESYTLASSDKSIRNISIQRKAAPAERGRSAPQSKGSRAWLWVIAIICVLVAALFVVLNLFKQTSVTVVPHSQPVVFDKTLQFTAYPSSGAATGTLVYSVQNADIQDSEPVEASGSVHKDIKASGSITVFNNYSDQPVQLVKNTRFQSSSGLIFRTPVAVNIPAKQGGTAGKVTITVQADAPGAQYNIAAGEKMTLPGLQSNADMFAAVSAQAASAFTGGFSGNAPNVSDDQLSTAKSTIDSRLQQKAQDYAKSIAAGDIVLTPTVAITEEAPVSASGTVQVVESAHVTVPVISSSDLAASIAQTVAANATTISYSFVPGSDFAATSADPQSQAGTDPITFSMSGTGMLVANVDKTALATALAGKDSAAFTAIVANFPGVDSAHAKIEPFWENTFPKDPSSIHIAIEQPAAQK